MSPNSLVPQIESPSATRETRRGASRDLYWWLGVLLVVLIMVASFLLVLNPAWVAWFGRWGYVGAFIVSMVASATVILPAPGIAVVIAMGSHLDPYLLGIVAGIGSAFGELSGYVAGATGRAFIPEKQKAQAERLRGLTKRYGPLILGVLAAIPFPLFDLAGIIAGMLRLRIISFLLAVAIGKSIKYIFLILLGTGSLQLLKYYLGH